jgi:hypothetical protein
MLLLGENASGKIKDKGKGLAGRICVALKEAVEIGESGGNMRLVGRGRGVGEVGQGEE